MAPLHLDDVRARFPGLGANEEVLLDNAGGAQVPESVIAEAARYFREDYVQVGADYARSQRATGTVARAHRMTETLMNAEGVGQVLLGMSTSTLCATLADAYRRAGGERRTVVIAEAGHEANIGPWARLEAAGWEVRMWRAHADGSTRLEDLAPLLEEGTVRIVALHHVSNLLGGIEDVRGAAELAHRHGAHIVVDGVAFAPHRAIDVQALGVDWYVFSTYKVFGPHLAALFGTHGALAELEGPNHYFIPVEDASYKWELGGVPHEGCAAWLGVGAYLAELGGSEALDRPAVEHAFAAMERFEAPLQDRLLEWLAARSDVRIVGPPEPGPGRVPTVSFVHASRSSRSIAVAANDAGLAIRFGHFYAHRLCHRLGLDPDDGVVRISAVHYNSPAEIERLIAFLEDLL